MLDLLKSCKQTFHHILSVMAPMDVDESATAPGLFAQCRFSVIRSNSLDDPAALKVGQLEDLHRLCRC